MSKLTASVAAAIFLLPTAYTGREKFAKYKAVEAYEIRPGILVMPRYSTDGQVCEIGLEMLHYSLGEVRLDSSLPRKDIDEIFNELVPSEERGPQPRNPVEQVAGGFISGRAVVNDEEYQNVSIKIYGKLSSPGDKGNETVEDVTARLKWKNRKCQ
jgi:hypothetical protein